MILVPFTSWSDVLAHAAAGKELWYRAPLDRAARRIRVMRISKHMRTLRVDPMNSDADNFTADEGHLNRFLKE